MRLTSYDLGKETFNHSLSQRAKSRLLGCGINPDLDSGLKESRRTNCSRVVIGVLVVCPIDESTVSDAGSETLLIVHIDEDLPTNKTDAPISIGNDAKNS
jgi:hypothetical protein